jgi:Helicase conserved C-terminal domain
MLTLEQFLCTQDLGYLQIVGGFWEVSLDASDVQSAAQLLVAVLLDPEHLNRMLNSLSQGGREALDDLLLAGGEMPWSLFTRRHGEVREMGPGRRARERPHLKPISASESLWYRGLIARSFFDAPQGPQEFAFIPADLMNILPQPQGSQKTHLGRAAKPDERAIPMFASDRILDHACTYLAALRLGFSEEKIAELSSAWQPTTLRNPFHLTPRALNDLLNTVSLLDTNSVPVPEITRHFLELPREKALAQLGRAWMYSPTFNELRLIPELIIEGEWQNDPLQARYTILDLFNSLPKDIWWSLTAFVEDIRKNQPDFQRPAGDYDSWYIRSKEKGNYLRGFDHWDEVDGALIRYIILGPLYWLGFVDLAAPTPDAFPVAFRFSRWAQALLSGIPPEGMEKEDETFLISSDARIRVPRLVPRVARYQLARFSEWTSETEDAYLYRLTPASLQLARKQGLRVIHLLTLLRRYALAVPPSLIKALERWQEHGTEAYLEQVMILRLRTPDMLNVLRTSRAARFLGEPLGPTAVIVKPEARDKVLAILAEMGYLGEARFEEK